ncbi:MAG: hypothetical protein AMXMBFR82_51760 [Candidatus Hydrogenedentota bacterium]
MNATHKNIGSIAPWDEESIGMPYEASCLVAFLWLLLACVLGMVSLFFVIPSLDEVITGSEVTPAQISPYVMLAIGLVLAYTAWRALRRMSRTAELRRAHVLRDTTPSSDGERDIKVVLVPVGVSVSLQGRATASFRDDCMSLSGVIQTIHPLYNLASLPLIPAGWYLGTRYADDTVMRGVIIALVLVIPYVSIFLYYRYYCGALAADSTLQIRPEAIRWSRCLGPYVRLKVRHSVLRGLSSIYIFVPSGYRQEFFRKFDCTFPGTLPSAYQRALAVARQVDSQRTSQTEE